MSSWGASFSTSFGDSWGEVATAEFIEPFHLTISSGENELSLNTGNNYVTLEDG